MRFGRTKSCQKAGPLMPDERTAGPRLKRERAGGHYAADPFLRLPARRPVLPHSRGEC
jgi:hypothetical protein